MSLIGKLESLQEINSPGIVFRETLGSKKYNLPKICPDKVPSLECIEGIWGEKDSVLVGRYLIEGNEVFSKEIVEVVDEKNKSITYAIFEGDMTKFYKILNVTFQVTSNGKKNYIKSTFEYEKLNSEIPAPEQFKDFVAEIIKMIDEYHLESDRIKNDHAQA